MLTKLMTRELTGKNVTKLMMGQLTVKDVIKVNQGSAERDGGYQS